MNSPLSVINFRRLHREIQEAVDQVFGQLLYEPFDAATKAQAKAMMSSFMMSLRNRKAVNHFMVDWSGDEFVVAYNPYGTHQMLHVRISFTPEGKFQALDNLIDDTPDFMEIFEEVMHG